MEPKVTAEDQEANYTFNANITVDAQSEQDEQEIVPPTVSIDYISRRGELVVKFSDDMVMPDNYTEYLA